MAAAAGDPYVFKWALALLPRLNWGRAESVLRQRWRAQAAVSTASDDCIRAPEPLNEAARAMGTVADDP